MVVNGGYSAPDTWVTEKTEESPWGELAVWQKVILRAFMESRLRADRAGNRPGELRPSFLLPAKVLTVAQ